MVKYQYTNKTDFRFYMKGTVTFDEIKKARGRKKKVSLSEILEMRQ